MSMLWTEGTEMREKILTIIEKNSRIELAELAVMLGVEEVDIINELEKLCLCF